DKGAEDLVVPRGRPGQRRAAYACPHRCVGVATAVLAEALINGVCSDPALWYGVHVRFTDQATVPVAQEQDDGGRRQAADLEQDEHRVVAMHCERTDE